MKKLRQVGHGKGHFLGKDYSCDKAKKGMLKKDDIHDRRLCRRRPSRSIWPRTACPPLATSLSRSAGGHPPRTSAKHNLVR